MSDEEAIPSEMLLYSGADDVHSSIIARVGVIEKFLQDNAEVHAGDRSFTMLRSFFDLFNDQLRINFDLRNRFAKEQHRKATGVREIDVERFFGEFSRIHGAEVRDITNLKAILSATLQYSTDMDTVIRAIEEAREANQVADAKVAQLVEECEEMEKRNDQGYDEMQACYQDVVSRVSELRPIASELTQKVDEMRTVVTRKEDKHAKLVHRVLERKTDVHKAFVDFEELRKSEKQRKRKLCHTIQQLRATRADLIGGDESLTNAVEQARSDLANVEKQATAEIRDLTRQMADTDHKINNVDARINEAMQQREMLIDQLQKLRSETEEASSTAQEIVCQAAKHSEEIRILEKAKRVLVSDSETNEHQMEVFAAIETETEAAISDRSSEIDILRSDNSKISSKIRVTVENIDITAKANTELASSVDCQLAELKKLRSAESQHRKRHAMYASTAAAFDKMRVALNCPDSATPHDVVAAAMKVTHRSHRKPTPGHISSRAISSDLQILSTKIQKIAANVA